VLDGLYFFELDTSFPTVFLELMTKSAVAFCNPVDVASERFGDYTKMTFDLFQLLGVHGLFV
jgi:hypothetical protein